MHVRFARAAIARVISPSPTADTDTDTAAADDDGDEVDHPTDAGGTQADHIIERKD